MHPLTSPPAKAGRRGRAARTVNTGQVCDCAERVHVHRSAHDAPVDKLKVLFEATRYHDPSVEHELHIGPLVSKAGLDKVAQAVAQARSDEASIVTDGGVADRLEGFHYEPTLITGARARSDITRREIFGPVLPLRIVDDLHEAIALANASDYGLMSPVYTGDLNAALQANRELRIRETSINRERFEAMEGYHDGRCRSGIGGTDGNHGLYENTEAHMAHIQGR